MSASARLPHGSLMGRGEPAAVSRDGCAPTVLAFHGFTGTPQEVHLVGEAAAESGLAFRAPLLPGHGTCAQDLAPMRWSDWVRAANAELNDARQAGPVIVAGLSLGSLIATELAVTQPRDVAGLVVLANATRLTRPFPDAALALASFLHLPDFMAPKASSDIGDDAMRAENLTYNAQPVAAAVSVRTAGKYVEGRVHQVLCPALVAHGVHDRVCPYANAERFMRLLPGSDKRLVRLERSHHVVTRDHDRDQLRAEISTFLRRLAQAT